MIIRSEGGSIVVSLLILMPIFASLFVLSAAAHLAIRTDAKSRHVCRVELLKSQQKIARHLADLLALNPRAKTLRQQREAAELRLKVAPTPAAKAAALVHLSLIIAKQVALGAQQKALVLAAESESRLGPIRASRQVSDSLSEDQAVYRQKALDLGSRARSDTATFDVVSTPKFSLTPNYEPSSTFEQKQTMRIRWHLSLAPLLPEWMNAWLPQNLGRLKLNAECAATMKKEKSKWAPILSAANL